MKADALVRLSFSGLFVLGTTLGWSAVASAEEVYTAMLVESRGLREDKTAQLTLTIEQFSTEEDTARLQEIFDEKGSDGLIEALHQMDRGVAQIKGGPTTRINHVRVHEGESGNQVIIVTNRPLYFPGDRPDTRSIGALGIVQLQTNKRGMGRGMMAEIIQVGVKKDGSLEIQTHNIATISLEDVQRLK
ncbi:MAG: hypothetical protein V3V11_03800 [Vicinamibacteria bacterium]